MLSILIVNWNTCDLLQACLASILQNPPSIPYEVIVVDNDSSDGSVKMVETQYKNVILLAQSQNLGYADGNNIAFKTAKGDWLLTLNPDTVITKGSLDVALNTLARKPNCGSLSIRFLNPDNSPQSSIRGFPTVAGIFGAFLKLDFVFPNSILGSYTQRNFDYESEGICDQPMGTFILFRRHSLASVGDPSAPFDTRFPIFFNEVDLLKRLADAGHPCWYTPQATVLHHHGGSTKQVKASMIWESHKSLVRYFHKHLRGFQRLALPIIGIAAGISALLRAKGYNAGFRPQRNNMQLEHH